MGRDVFPAQLSAQPIVGSAYSLHMRAAGDPIAP